VTIDGHLALLCAERERLVAALEEHGLVRERPLVKAGEPIATDLVANPLLRELRALDDQIIKLMLARSGGEQSPEDDPFAEFDPAGVR
jgi:hypothetical protein